jgi:hypothetical protein
MTAPKKLAGKPTQSTKASQSTPKTKATVKSTAKTASKPVADHPDVVAGQLVRLHELKGFTALFLPAELEQLLSEANYQALREELRWFTITVMVRDVDRLIHVDLPVILTQREPLLPGKAATTQRRRTSRKGADHG